MTNEVSQEVHAAIERYRSYMREVRYRTDVVSRVVQELGSGGSTTGYRESDLELIYLQLRHCLELIMFASLVAHDSHGLSLSKKILRSEYNASKILKFIKRKNPSFYPKPMKAIEVQGDDGIWRPEELEEGYLTEREFCELYDRTCGRILHAQREVKFSGNYEELVGLARGYLAKIIALLNNHWVNITEDYVFRVIMLDESTKDIGINYLEKVDTLLEGKVRPYNSQ